MTDETIQITYKLDKHHHLFFGNNCLHILHYKIPLCLLLSSNTSPKLGSLDLWPAFFTLNSILEKNNRKKSNQIMIKIEKSDFYFNLEQSYCQRFQSSSHLMSLVYLLSFNVKSDSAIYVCLNFITMHIIEFFKALSGSLQSDSTSLVTWNFSEQPIGSE